MDHTEYFMYVGQAPNKSGADGIVAKATQTKDGPWKVVGEDGRVIRKLAATEKDVVSVMKKEFKAKEVFFIHNYESGQQTIKEVGV
jgi:hypothetical protein